MDEFRQLLFRRFHPFLDVGSVGLILLFLFTTTNLNHMPEGIDEFLAMRLTVKNMVLMGLFAVVWTTIFRLCGLYDSQKLGSLNEEIWKIVRACSVGSLFLLLFPLASNSGSLSYDLAFYFWPLSMAFSVVGRFLVRGVATYCESNPERLRNVIIVGTGPRGAELYREIQKNSSQQYHVLGFVDTVGDQVVAPEVRECLLGSLGDLERLLATQVVDQVFITLPIKSCYDEVQQTIAPAKRLAWNRSSSWKTYSSYLLHGSNTSRKGEAR